MNNIDYQLSDDQNTLTRGNVQYQAINDTIFVGDVHSKSWWLVGNQIHIQPM